MPTREELAKVKPPQDVINEIAKVSEISGQSKDKVKNAFYKALALKTLDVFTDMDERCRQAMYIMIAQLKAKMPSDNTPLFPMEFTVFAVTSPKTIPMKNEKVDPVSGNKITVTEPRNVANVYGVFAGGPNPDPNAPQLPAKLGFLSLWGDACQLVTQFKKGNSYLASMGVKNKDDHYELSLSNVVKIEESKNDLPPIKEIIAKFFSPFSVSQIPIHPGNNQFVHGRIVRGWTKLDRNGQNRGYVVMADPLIGASMLASVAGGEKREYQVMFSNAPEFATEYGAGTECYFMARIDNKSEQYGVSVYGDFIVPITISTTDPEAASVWDDDPFDYGEPEESSPSPEPIQTAPAPAQVPVAAQAPVQTPAPEQVQTPVTTPPNNIPSPAANGEW